MTGARRVLYSLLTMNGWQHKGAFVVRFQAETDVTARVFKGRIEHVASGDSAHFNSLDELQKFLDRTLRKVQVDLQEAGTLPGQPKPLVKS